VDVTQEAARCRPELDRQSFALEAVEQTATIKVEVAAGCAWTARAASPWITILEGATGAGAGRVRFRVGPNGAATPRTGSLEVAGVRVDVRQLGGVPPSCTFAIDPDSAEAGPEGADGTVSVRADEDCPWTAVSNQGWLTVVSGASGSGSGAVRYRASANTGPSLRSGHITIGGLLFTFTQAGCSYSIDPTSQSFPSLGGSGRIDVGTDDACAWTANATSSWITITSGGSGQGDGRIEFDVKPNTLLADRSGSIVVAGRTFAVRQDGAVSLSGRVRELEGSCPTRRFTLKGQAVRTTSATDYERGDCGDLKDGVSVRIKGIAGLDGVVTAIEVDF
jgi:hypothetical protein